MRKFILAGLLTFGILAPGLAIAQTTDGEAPSALPSVKQFSYIYNPSLPGWDRVRTPTKFISLNAVAITSETTVWTPAAGKKFRLMGFALAQGTVSGGVTLKDNTAGTTILILPSNTAGAVLISPSMGNGILSATANNVLTATGIATETLTGYLFGTEE